MISYSSVFCFNFDKKNMRGTSLTNEVSISEYTREIINSYSDYEIPSNTNSLSNEFNQIQ